MAYNNGAFQNDYDFNPPVACSLGSTPSCYTALTLNSEGVDTFDVSNRNSIISIHQMPQHTENSDPGQAPSMSNFIDHSNDIIINVENSATVGTYVNLLTSSSSTASSQQSGVNLEETPSSSTIASNNSNPSNNSPTSTTDTVEGMLEAQRLMSVKYLPFVLILIAKAGYDHCGNLIKVVLLCGAFMHANYVVKKESTTQTPRSFWKLLFALLIISSCLIFIAYIFDDEKLYLNLVFMPPLKHPTTAWNLLWITCLTEFILKLITVAIKLALTMIPVYFIPSQKRGRIYLFIEATSQFYRSLAPIQPWLHYLLESYQGAEKIVGVFLSAAYMVTKGNDLLCRFRFFRVAILKLITNAIIGSSPTKEQIQNAGNHCPICHDRYDSPVLLQCNHIFCESCICTWLDREPTCPLCRSTIADDPSWRDGSTSFFMQVY